MFINDISKYHEFDILLFVSEEDNDDLINKIESIIFKPNNNLILANVKV